ncbi:MAG: 30S ribosomal protein S2 [Alphaproteobacteria bacterium]|nr:30S ribosomal protein S2 [Alphaproteobacteria bacterium]
MALPTFTMRQLIEAGVHFGHNTRRWNPKMKEFIFGTRENVHIIDLQQTVPMLYQAMQAAHDVAAKGGHILFVGTKTQAQQAVREAAERCGQYYVNHRWLGGTLTNWKTVSGSIRRLKDIDAKQEKGEFDGLTKKEKLNLSRDREKLDLSLGGIKDMGGRPDLIFVIDTVKEDLALKEARRLGIPVIAICDTNSDPDGIEYPVPGNDDAIRAINMYCDLIAGSILDGIQAELVASGVDVGAQETVVEDVEVADEVNA